MKDYYNTLEEAFEALKQIIHDFGYLDPPPKPPGFENMMLMINTLGNTVCARTSLAGQMVSLSIIVPKDKTQEDRYFVNAQEVRRALPQLEIDLVREEGEPGGVLGDGLKGLGLGIKWAMLRNGLDIDDE